MNDDIRDIVAQWLANADVDWTTVEILSAHPGAPLGAVGFHCQQYVEKLLKAFLTVHQIEAPRTHELRVLIALAGPIIPALTELSERSDDLSRYGVDTRYPDNWQKAPADEMQRILDLTEDLP